METESSNTKKIITTVVLVAVVAFAAYFFFFRSVEVEMVLDEFGNPVQAQVVGQDLIDLLHELESVKLDDAIFSSPALQNLVDLSVTLTPQPQGRDNPFSSISGSGAAPKTR